MALYIDIHRNHHDATAEGVRQAHVSDLEAQEKYGVRYLKYWFNQKAGTICCLVDAPNKEAAIATHRDAHGGLADQIIEVESEMVEAFLGGQQVDDFDCVVDRGGRVDTAFRTVLFTDLEGSTSLTQRLGDDGAMQLLRTHDAIIRSALSASGGREVKHTGDGIMASFVQASSAIECAVAILRALAAYNAEAAEPIKVRIGLSAGEPVSEGNDIFGAAVQLARRVCDEGDAGRILVANVVRELCIGKAFAFQDLGERKLKGFEQPVRLHEVAWS
ncbi:MAG: nickel-binding protein [Planctomycetota bacterium]|jgi:class 3 adenylate cyclase